MENTRCVLGSAETDETAQDAVILRQDVFCSSFFSSPSLFSKLLTALLHPSRQKPLFPVLFSRGAKHFSLGSPSCVQRHRPTAPPRKRTRFIQGMSARPSLGRLGAGGSCVPCFGNLALCTPAPLAATPGT